MRLDEESSPLSRRSCLSASPPSLVSLTSRVYFKSQYRLLNAEATRCSTISVLGIARATEGLFSEKGMSVPWLLAWCAVWITVNLQDCPQSKNDWILFDPFISYPQACSLPWPIIDYVTQYFGPILSMALVYPPAGLFFVRWAEEWHCRITCHCFDQRTSVFPRVQATWAILHGPSNVPQLNGNLGKSLIVEHKNIPLVLLATFPVWIWTGNRGNH